MKRDRYQTMQPIFKTIRTVLITYLISPLYSNNYDFVSLPSRYRYNVTVTDRRPPLHTVTDRYRPFPIVTKRYVRYRTLQALQTVNPNFK